MTGGFPCQAFSIAGHRKGFDDERGSLVFELLRVVKELMPRVVFLENVKNLKSHSEGKTLQHIISAFEKIVYTVKMEVMNACEYSHIPQNRERVYILCFKNEKDTNKFQFPTQKPMELTRKLIQSRINGNNGRTLIPFVGSGSECVTAKNLGVEYVGIELNPEYVEYANKWLKIID